MLQIVPDLVLDTPTAPALLEKFTQQAISDGCLPKDYVAPVVEAVPSAADSVDLQKENGSHDASTTT